MSSVAKRIAQDAFELGIKKGDTLLVHSSLRSLGAGVTPEEVVAGLFEAVGEQGTLVFPALSYLSCNSKNPRFDYYETRSNVGAIPEYFRTSAEGVLRSLNPTHSCCAIGKNADFVISGHKYDTTPCGKNSPFARVADSDGKILFLGCGMRPNTSMHAVEELVEPDYLFGDTVEYTVKDKNGEESKLTCRAHGFDGVAQRYERLAELLEGDELRIGKILEADCHLVQARAMWKKAAKKFAEDPYYFVDKVDDR